MVYHKVKGKSLSCHLTLCYHIGSGLLKAYQMPERQTAGDNTMI